MRRLEDDAHQIFFTVFHEKEGEKFIFLTCNELYTVLILYLLHNANFLLDIAFHLGCLRKFIYHLQSKELVSRLALVHMAKGAVPNA